MMPSDPTARDENKEEKEDETPGAKTGDYSHKEEDLQSVEGAQAIPDQEL